MNNLLNIALRAIPSTTIQYEKYLASGIGFGGIAKNTYDAPKTIINAVAQPLSNKLYKEYGLDFQKRYMRFFASCDMLALEYDNASPDRITYDGTKWIVVQVKRWHSYNGWSEIVAIAEKDYNK